MRKRIALAGLLLTAGLGASGAPKFIGHGWDMLDSPLTSVRASAEAFRTTGLDGVAISIPQTKQTDGSRISSLSLPQDASWRYGSLAAYEPLLKGFRDASGLKENFLICLWHYTRGRLSWTDDAAWRRFAGNMQVLARLAKRGGMKGIFIDAEDYTKERQFYRAASDPEYDKCAALARQRGREVFAGVFREFPDATVLSFWFFTACRGLESQDPAGLARLDGNLWPHFMNGILDVLPMTARLIDGDESAYKYDSTHAFNAGATRQFWRALQLVAPENRAKFRSCMGVGFGQYMDMYVNEKGKCGSWYFGPVAGSRLEHFRRNLTSAARTAEYVWLYGEKASWVSWKDPVPFRRKWGYSRSTTWEDRLPGFADILAELRDPASAARAVSDRLRSAGAKNLYAANIGRRWAHPKNLNGSFKVSKGDDGLFSRLDAAGVANGSYHVPVDGVNEADSYVVDLRVRGDIGGHAELIWRTNGPFNWHLGRHPVLAGEVDAQGWRRCSRIFHAPAGADGLMFRINVNQAKGESASFRDIAVYKISGTSGPAPLFSDGESAWTVVLPKNAARPVRYAAAELTNTIAKISGASIPVTEEGKFPAKNVIRLVQEGDSLEDVFSVKTRPDGIVLKGSSPRAVMFAAYAFLRDRLGARWYWPGKDGEYLPDLRRYDVPSWEKEYRSPFPLREMSIVGIPGHRHHATERWFAKQFLNSGINTPAVQEDVGLVRITNGHYVTLPGDKKSKERLFSEHPDWFSLLNGKRDIKGLAGCWSSKGYFDYVVSNLVNLVRSRKADIANLFPTDIAPRCECAGCVKNPDISARWWEYYAKIIDAMRKEIPQQRFAGIAYMEYRAVPGVKVKNLDYVEYCHYNRCYFHSLGDPQCTRNARSMDEFRSWRRQAPLGLYGYEFDIFRRAPYIPIWRVIADEMKVFRDMRLTRLKTEYGVDMHKLYGKKPLKRSQIGQISCRLSYYVWAAMAFDPSADVNALVDDFCKHVYGAGAPAMRAYHDVMADAWNAMDRHVTYFNNEMRYFADRLISPEVEKKALGHLRNAAAAAKGNARALREIAVDAECFARWQDAAKSARTEGEVLELDDIREEEGFTVVGWLEAKSRSGKKFQPTRFKVLRGARALHVLAECEEKENPGFDRGTTENDKRLFNWEASSIELFIDSGDGSSRQIAVMPAGGVWDAKDGDMSWNSGLVARPTFSKTGWRIEMSIPYANLGGAPKPGDRWKLMVIRNAETGSKFSSCGWPLNAHRDFSSAATLKFK